jgi:hypothetical protein
MMKRRQQREREQVRAMPGAKEEEQKSEDEAE